MKNYPPPRISVSLKVTIIKYDPTCNFDGSIIVTAYGGKLPYTYYIKDNPPQNTGNFVNLDAMVYDIYVKDADGVVVDTLVELKNIYNPPTCVVTGYQAPSSCDKSDGYVTVESQGGMPPYKYSLDMINFQSSNIFSNLPSGLYGLFYMVDANGCIVQIEIPLTAIVQFLCNESLNSTYSYAACKNDGVVVVSDGGDYGPYQYSMDNSSYSINGSYYGLSPGMHILKVKDRLGRVKSFSVPMPQMCNIAIDYIIEDAACMQDDGKLTINAVNGLAPYEFTLDGINYQTSNVFTNLASGNYSITVRDSKGNKRSRGATVSDRCPIITVVTTNESCTKKDGAITTSGYKGTTPYKFSLDGTNFQSSNVFNGLTTGDYTVTIKDVNGFTSTATASINDACLNAQALVTNATCANNNGKITVMASNGTLPYTYSIDGNNFQSDNVFNSMAPGTYTVVVKDLFGLTGNATVTVTNIPGPQLSATFTPTSCAKNDGIIQITTLGAGPFSYSLDNISYQSLNQFTAISNGSYTVWVKDGNGCPASKEGSVEIDCPLVSLFSTEESCDKRDGSITALAANGKAPYQYSLDGINFQTDTKFNGLKTGNYTITIKDAYEHINTADVMVIRRCPVISAVVSNGFCGAAKGVVTANTINGTPPYLYSINAGNFQANNAFNNLASGTYTVSAKDAKGLISSIDVTISNFPGPEMSISEHPASCTNNDGQITITALGGSLPLSYSIGNANFQNANVFDNLPAGSYTAVTKDVNGCLASAEVIVKNNDDLQLSTNEGTTICEGDKTTLHALSNAAAFQWSPEAGLDNVLIQNPTAGPTKSTKYYVQAILGICKALDSVSIVIDPAPIADAGDNTTVCYGQNTQLDGGSTGVVGFNWSPSVYLSNSKIADPLVTEPEETTVYSLQVTDSKGCKSLNNAQVTITVTPQTKLFAGNDTSIVMNQPFQLNATDINNAGFIKYSWLPTTGLNNSSLQNPVIIIDKSITYTVEAVTSAGCKGRDDITLSVYKKSDIYMPNAFTPNNDGNNDILRPILIGIKSFKYFSVYNRLGQRIFYSEDWGKGWDGTINNVPQNTGTYIWEVSGVDFTGKVIFYKGTSVLIR